MTVCSACGQERAPSPSDWLSPDEIRLVEFLQVRLSEHRDAVDAYTTGPARVAAVAAVDLSASAGSVVHAFAWTQDQGVRARLRFVLLLLSQPWIYHRDHEWVDELKERLGCL